MIESGRIVFSDTMDAFNNYVQPSSVLMKMENPPVAAELQKVAGVTRVEFLTERQARIYFSGDTDITERLVSASVQHEWRLREISLDKGLLDEVFKQITTQSIQ